jgi:RNA polymerase sigma factor (sigma-70 family)
MKYLKNEEDAKDAVQQVFSKVITELPKYEVAYFSSWLYTVARNHCLIMLRQKKTVPADENLSIADDQAEYPLIESAERQSDEKVLQLVEEGLAQLQEPQKQCVSLFYLQHQSYQQIASTTGISLMQVKSAIQNGKRNIRIWVEKKMKQNHAS